MNLLTRQTVLLFALGITLALTLASCAVTRTEVDNYTITLRDTTYRETVRNVPGGADDNGVVFPSSRTTYIDRSTTSYDSTVTREYPNFLRFGGVEFAGLIGTSSHQGAGPGLLGVYSLLDSTMLKQPGGLLRAAGDSDKVADKSLFKGLMFRLAPVEYELHWFNNTPDWTIGTSFMEVFAPDEFRKNRLTSILSNVYLRRRFWIRDRIPYLIAAPYIGFSAFPSAYVNLGGELQFGSFGGLNLRGYVGYINGFTWNADPGKTAPAVNFPYIGLGISALDFTNRPEETERTWSEYVKSAIEVSVMDISLINAGGLPTVFSDSVARLPLTGGILRFATSHFPLPVLGGHLFAGTTLLEYFALGFRQQAFSVLPLRVGYRQYLFAEDLSLEPFVELNYYPSSFINVGARLRIDTFNGFTVGVEGGYASGSPGAFLPTVVLKNGSKILENFSKLYVGVSFGLSTELLTPEHVAELRALEH